VVIAITAIIKLPKAMKKEAIAILLDVMACSKAFSDVLLRSSRKSTTILPSISLLTFH